MTITGAHVLLYSPEADALRAMLGDTFGLKGVEAGVGPQRIGLGRVQQHMCAGDSHLPMAFSRFSAVALTTDGECPRFIIPPAS